MPRQWKSAAGPVQPPGREDQHALTWIRATRRSSLGKVARKWPCTREGKPTGGPPRPAPAGVALSRGRGGIGRVVSPGMAASARRRLPFPCVAAVDPTSPHYRPDTTAIPPPSTPWGPGSRSLLSPSARIAARNQRHYNWPAHPALCPPPSSPNSGTRAHKSSPHLPLVWLARVSEQLRFLVFLISGAPVAEILVQQS